MWYKNTNGILINLYRQGSFQIHQAHNFQVIANNGIPIEEFDSKEEAESFIDFLTVNLRAITFNGFSEWQEDNQTYAKTSV